MDIKLMPSGLIWAPLAASEYDIYEFAKSRDLRPYSVRCVAVHASGCFWRLLSFNESLNYLTSLGY